MEKIIKSILIFSTIIFVLNIFSPLTFTSSIISYLIFFLSFVSGYMYFGRRNNKINFRNTIFCLSILGLVFLIKAFSWGGDWKTQTIIYQNRNLSSRTIEFQMQDTGALGYNKRTVDKTKLLPFVYWINEIDETNIDMLKWQKVDIYVNELALKGG